MGVLKNRKGGRRLYVHSSLSQRLKEVHEDLKDYLGSRLTFFESTEILGEGFQITPLYEFEDLPDGYSYCNSCEKVFRPPFGSDGYPFCQKCFYKIISDGMIKKTDQLKKFLWS